MDFGRHNFQRNSSAVCTLHVVYTKWGIISSWVALCSDCSWRDGERLATAYGCWKMHIVWCAREILNANFQGADSLRCHRHRSIHCCHEERRMSHNRAWCIYYTFYFRREGCLAWLQMTTQRISLYMPIYSFLWRRTLLCNWTTACGMCQGSKLPPQYHSIWPNN